MDVGSLPNRELLRLIVLLTIGVLVFAGIFVGTLISYARKRRRISKAQQGAVDGAPAGVNVIQMGSKQNAMGTLLKSSGKQEPSPTLYAEAEPTTTPGPGSEGAENSAARYRELFRVLVDVDTRKVVLEVEGQRFAGLKQVKEREVGRRILEGVAALLNFTQGLIATANGIKALQVSPATITHLPDPPTISPAQPTPASTAPTPTAQDNEGAPAAAVDLADRWQFLAGLETQMQRSTQATGESSASKQRWRFGRRARPTPQTPETPLLNLAEEIDTILQSKLLAANIPTNVKIHSGFGGHIRIQVGETFYNSVDQVENQIIQELIKGAIKEWERQ